MNMPKILDQDKIYALLKAFYKHLCHNQPPFDLEEKKKKKR